MSDDLVAFLSARLNEDEERAKAALTPGVYRWVDIHPDLDWVITQAEGDFAEVLPRRWLAEAQAKRAILAEYGRARAKHEKYSGAVDRELSGWWAGRVIQLDRDICRLAAVYSGHADYQKKWESRTTSVVPGQEGVPEMTPVAEFSDSPGGRLPEEIDHV